MRWSPIGDLVHTAQKGRPATARRLCVASEDYNYSTFDMDREQPVIDAFSDNPIRVGTRAPSFPLEDLAGGEIVEMKDLWRQGLVVIEFGSFT